MESSSLAVSLRIAEQILIRYVESFVFIFGAIGSIVNLVLFSKTSLRSSSCCTYFFASSLITLILLSTGILPLIYAQYNALNPFFSVNGFCKIRAYVNQWSAMSCRWLLVMACIDRCFACSISPNVRRFLNVHIARRIAISIVIFWTILPMHLLIYANIIPPGNIGCIISNNNLAIYHGIYTIVMGGTLPPIVMLVCTAFIWQRIIIKNQRRALHATVISNRQYNIRGHQFLILLLAQVAIFIFSTIPFMSNSLYTALTREIENKSADRRAIERFAQVITELFVYVFPAVSFYSNILVSRKFRKKLVDILKGCQDSFCCTRIRIVPIAQS